MDKQARIKRISLMENRFDKVTRVLGELDKAICEYEDFKDEPEGLKRGVLSEDGLYNLLNDADEIIVKALKVLGGR